MPAFLQFIDLSGNELRNFLVQSLASAPTSVAGRMYFDTSDNVLKYYDGTDWITVGAAGEAISDHGALTGLGDDDHTQYILVDASRDFTATPAVNGNDVWHAGNDGAGSGLDADTVDGVEAATLATVTYVDGEIANLVDTAPATLDTLNELAAALGDDPNFATTVTNQIAAKPDKFADDVGDGAATSIVVNHGLGSEDVLVQVYDNASNATVFCGVTRTDANNVTLAFSSAPAANEYRVVVIG